MDDYLKMDYKMMAEIAAELKDKFRYTPDEVLEMRRGWNENNGKSGFEIITLFSKLMKYDNREYITGYFDILKRAKKACLFLNAEQQRYADMPMLDRLGFLDMFEGKK